MRKLVVFGVGPFAEMAAHYFESAGGYKVVAYAAHEKFMPPSWHGPRPLHMFESLPAHFPPAEHEVFIALEHARQNMARAEIAAEAKAMGYRLASFISPTASIATNVAFGEHCFVMEQVVVQYGSCFAENNILGAKSFFGQACQIGAHNYFGAAFFADRSVVIGSHSVFESHVRVAASVQVHDWTFVKAFQDIASSITEPTIIHSALRAPGRVVDRHTH